MTTKIALVGIGKIARDQHIPALAASPDFELAATASRNGSVDGIEAFTELATLLDARPDISCISLCTPPQYRYADARAALEAGRHVVLEKPPGATLSEVEDLIALARENSVSLYATWHSRHAPAVAATRAWLADKTVQCINIVWKEDVRRWHPGQEWIWAPGGLGVFDPGINALSILTEIFQRPLRLTRAELEFPENRETPIAADLSFAEAGGGVVTAVFDWRQEGPQTWEIEISTVEGDAVLADGGASLTVGGAPVDAATPADALAGEYHTIYKRIAAKLKRGESETDIAPLRHVADAFMLGRRSTVAPFNW